MRSLRVDSSSCEKGVVSEEGHSTYKGLNHLGAFGPGRLEFGSQVFQLYIILARFDIKFKIFVILQM